MDVGIKMSFEEDKFTTTLIFTCNLNPYGEIGIITITGPGTVFCKTYIIFIL